MKSKSTIIIALIAVIAVGLLVWGAKGSPSENGVALATGITAGTIGGEVPSYDFGSVSMLRGNVEHDFTFTNPKDGALTVNSVETSCMCTRAILILQDGKEFGPFGMAGHGFNPSVDALVPAGETFTVRAIFDPAAHGPAGIGLIERDVLVGTSKGQITTHFKAQVTP